MNIEWHFKEAGPGDRARESQVEKFFNSDAVANKANAIVREGIQNSLDAAQDAPAIRVRISVGVWSAAKRADRLGRYLVGFNDHFDVPAVRNKIASPPGPEEPFRYLVFEDFGTSGLKGDAAQWWPDEQGQPNPFFNYFRAEGISDKTDGARGRHGVGRLVFMFASRIHSIFGLTRREDQSVTEELLMGTSVLRNHWFNDKPYLPDGWFGIKDEVDPRLTLPLNGDNAKFINQFKQDFGVSRKDESGLSVIVPWLNQEVTVEEVHKAVVSGYFHPILRKKLVVEVASETGVVQAINADTIDAVVDTLPADVTAQLKPILSLAKAALAATEDIQLGAPPGTGAPRWDPSVMAEPVLQAIHDKLEAGDVLTIGVPTRVRLKNKDAIDCHFTIYLERDATVTDGQVIFIREGIIVSDVRPRRASGIRALVVIDEGPLATFLGDSENPSHTEWQATMLREKYSFNRATIDHVVQSVPTILSIISQQQKRPDPSLLIDLFSLPADEGVKAKQKKRPKKKGDETEPEEFDIPKTLRRFVIDKRADGFVVRRGDPGAKRPPQLAIKVAYGVRRGSPFSKYNPADFRLGLGGIECTALGCEIVDFENNWMLVQIIEDEFEVAVTGFDTSHRDLHVDARIKGEDATAADDEAAEAEEEVAHAATA